MIAKTFPLYLSRNQLRRLYDVACEQVAYADSLVDCSESEYWAEIARMILDTLAADE